MANHRQPGSQRPGQRALRRRLSKPSDLEELQKGRNPLNGPAPIRDGTPLVSHGLGNQATGAVLGLSGAPAAAPQTVARKAVTTALIQRATFAELMAFWRTQELKEKPEKAQVIANQQAKTLDPEPANEESKEEVEQQTEDSSVSEEAKEGGGLPSGYVAQEEAKEASESLSEGAESEEEEKKVVGSVYSQSPGKDEQSGEQPGVFYSQPEEKKGSGYDKPDLSGERSESLSPDSEEKGQDEAKVSATKYSVPDQEPGQDNGTRSETLSPSSEEQKAPVAPPAPVGTGNKTKVKYLQPGEAREEFALNVSGSVSQAGKPYDTSHMYSKFKGDGFGIYVMDKNGKFYSNSHKIGLFHHSSFLGGGDVTGAGEMKVTGGKLDFITNKSGHYFPGKVQMAQALVQLQWTAGFDSAHIGVFDNGRYEDDLPGGAAEWLKDNRLLLAGSSDNKDTQKYSAKSMQGHKGEEQDSVDLVRFLIQDYAGKAKLGKLKKFNKPNPAFGDTIADIKTLVLQEFGWDQTDLETYKEVIENWNNDKPIGVPPGPPPPMKASASASQSPTSPSPDDTDKTGSSKSGGRDWTAELEELLLQNPNPDWRALGLVEDEGMWTITSPSGSMFVAARDEHKVQLLKGETSIDALRPDDPDF